MASPHQADEIEHVLAVFDELDRDLESAESKLRYLGDVSQFYEHLQRCRKATYNPADMIEWSTRVGTHRTQ
ncbi:hypothetical protein [Natrinema soli]|uniref:Uncharacterized protein n=1 Tax=Natrinema soli TaxID=1930624 RepID=A0ABD5SYE4_9EURY|nr:hypothetical protein [Natrinema soli]